MFTLCLNIIGLLFCFFFLLPNVCVCVRACVCVCVRVHVCMRACLRARVCVHVCTHTHTHTHMHTHAHAHTHAHTHTRTHTCTCTRTHTHTHTHTHSVGVSFPINRTGLNWHCYMLIYNTEVYLLTNVPSRTPPPSPLHRLPKYLLPPNTVLPHTLGLIT